MAASPRLVVRAEFPPTRETGLVQREGNVSAGGIGIGGGIGAGRSPRPRVSAGPGDGPGEVMEQVEIGLFTDPEGQVVGVVKAA